MTRKDIIFIGGVIAWLVIGLYIAYYTEFNINLYHLCWVGIFGIICLMKKYWKEFNNWIEHKI